MAGAHNILRSHGHRLSVIIGALTCARPSHKGFASDGNYIGDQDNWEGINEAYQTAIAGAGRSDVLRRATDEISARIDKIDADFAARYGTRSGTPDAVSAAAATENEGTHPEEVEPSPLLAVR
jgi:hypothetical protein